MPAASPSLPQYRVTLFYGPEPLSADGGGQRCVFNVKKRSWKAGVQVVVELETGDLDEARRVLEFDAWLPELLAPIEATERDAYVHRAEEVFVQAVCALKLDIALESGLRQENQCLQGPAWREALRGRLPGARDRLRRQISDELDVVSS